ncbi:MAG: right-handed parallel beta-helix repeat-containing protein, partial [Paludibacter sp.]
FSQGKITKLSSDKSTIEFRLDDNYPDNLVERIEIFDPKTNLLKRSSHYGWTKFEKLADRYYRVTKGQKYKFKPTIDTEEVGDILVTNNDFTPHGNKPHAVFSDECVNLRLENITLYSGNCFGFFETNGTKNTYLKCVIDRRSPETDMYVRSKRIRSNDADAFHSKFAIIGPQIIECSAKFQGDDGVNICGKYYLSTGAVGNVIRLIVPQTCDIPVGTSLEILTVDGKRLPIAKVLKIEDDGLISNEEIEAVLNLKQNENNKRRLSNPQNKILKLIVDKELTFGFGAVIADVNKMGNGFLVKNCNFSYNRSRGILIKASNGCLIGNTLQGNWMTSVLISPEAWWLESGCSDNIDVSNNIILDNKQDKAIKVTGEGFDDVTPPVGLHNNINITNNQFTNCLLPVIYLGSTKNGNITGNIITKLALSNQNVQNSTNAMVINSENVKTDF